MMHNLEDMKEQEHSKFRNIHPSEEITYFLRHGKDTVWPVDDFGFKGADHLPAKRPQRPRDSQLVILDSSKQVMYPLRGNKGCGMVKW
jgi:hypothetical protein